MSSRAIQVLHNFILSLYFMQNQGYRLKQIRMNLRLSQEAFGEEIGLTRAGIAAVEGNKNKFSQDVLYKLLKQFNINLNYLISGQGEMFINECKYTHTILKNNESLENFKNWGNRLTNILTQNNLTPYEFAKLTRIKESRIDKFILKSDMPTIEEINAIKNNVDISIDELLYGEKISSCTQTSGIELSTDEIFKLKKMIRDYSI